MRRNGHAAAMETSLLLGSRPLLDDASPLPTTVPFSTAEATAAGVSKHRLAALTQAGLVRRVLKGVYVATQVTDSLLVRAQALALVVPEGAAITDWTACWLWTGILPPGQHTDIPPVCIFRFAGRGRLRNQLCSSGERTFLPDDLVQVEGISVTTPLRTAWDLGRLARRDMAFAALDALLRLAAFSRDQLLDGVGRFKGHRGVVQLRALAPLADPRAESPGESVLRLRWLDLPSLPPPTPQVPILGPDGREIYRIDLGVEEIRFGAEYDGEEFHSSDEDKQHDGERREVLSRRYHWVIKPVEKSNVFGLNRDVERILYDGVLEARRALGKFRGVERR
jgi:hypothetical protein